MFETGKYEKRTALYFHRASPESRIGCGHDRRTQELARRLGLAAVIACCWTGYAAAVDTHVTSTAPIKIAVFAFELEDFSAAGKQGETSYLAQSTQEALAQSTEEAKQLLLQSGRYRLIDTTDADLGAAKGQGLRNCRGCEAAIAMKLGADQALIGVVTKISMTEYAVRFQVSDARNGEIISRLATDLRMGADYSWSRGVRWLMQNRMLAPK
jgi:Protein of unknown function (DUF2380)